MEPRAHTLANVAPCLLTLRQQFNDDFPNRSKASDGIWPSAAHTAANPTSDHEYGNALDITDNLGDGKTVTPEMARRISADPRTKYTIHDRTLYKAGVGKPYSGSNPHTGHIHISVYEATRADARAWDFYTKPEEVEEVKPLDHALICGNYSTEVQRLALLDEFTQQKVAKAFGIGTWACHAKQGAKSDAIGSRARALGLDIISMPVTEDGYTALRLVTVGARPDGECKALQDSLAAIYTVVNTRTPDSLK